jgi:L,D-peptidoglycan transpeptidase YkuD (ErfK/YbiS/YcfS/YnhG family)
MPYRQIERDDIWVDDPRSVDYNKWTKLGNTDAGSFEEMKRDDGLYRYGVVIGYNRNPVVAGLGSAIFLHVWRGRGEPTSGCIAMAENDVVRILSWLNPRQKPLVAIGALPALISTRFP